VSPGLGTLAFGSSPGVTLLSANNVNQLRFDGTLANLQTMLAGSNITLSPTTNFSGTMALGAVVSDQIAAPVGHSALVQVRGVNDAPTLSFTVPVLNAVEDTALSLHGVVTIADVDALGFSTRLTLTVGMGTLSVAPTSGVSVTPVSAQTKVLNGTLGALQTTLGTSNAVVFTPMLNINTSTTFAATYSDMGASAFAPSPALVASGSIPVNITPVNDEPTLSGSNIMTVTTVATVTTWVTNAVPTSALNTIDVDGDPPNAIIYTVQTLPAIGSLRLNNVPLAACPGPGHTFTQADVNAAKVTYSHNSMVVATPNLAYRVANSATCSGGAAGSLEIRIRAP